MIIYNHINLLIINSPKQLYNRSALNVFARSFLVFTNKRIICVTDLSPQRLMSVFNDRKYEMCNKTCFSKQIFDCAHVQCGFFWHVIQLLITAFIQSTFRHCLSLIVRILMSSYLTEVHIGEEWKFREIKFENCHFNCDDNIGVEAVWHFTYDCY